MSHQTARDKGGSSAPGEPRFEMKITIENLTPVALQLVDIRVSGKTDDGYSSGGCHESFPNTIIQGNENVTVTVWPRPTLNPSRATYKVSATMKWGNDGLFPNKEFFEVSRIKPAILQIEFQ